MGMDHDSEISEAAQTSQAALARTCGVEIRRLSIGELKPSPHNPRKKLTPQDLEYRRIDKSLDHHGYVDPIIWNELTGHIVGGHQRVEILRSKGVTELDVVVIHVSLKQEKALCIALNKAVGDWDLDHLALVLQDIMQDPELDLESTGFEAGEAGDLIEDILGIEGEDRQETASVEDLLARGGPPVTQPGDLIELGGHKLLCGDSTDVASVSRLMSGAKAVLLATDPPYLVDYDGTNHPGSGKRRQTRKDWSGTYGVSWDDAAAHPDLYDKAIAAAVEAAVATNTAWYWWHASRRQAMLEEVWERHGLFVHCQIIWVKNKGVPTRTWYLWRHEPCFFGWRRGHPPPKYGRKKLSTVWEIDTLPNGPQRPDHPTPKPLEVFEVPMRQHTRAGDVCYEPFAGSGTQLIAAERLGRRCFAIEVSPGYCDLIVRRFIAFAGEGAVSPELAHRYRLSEQEAA